MCLYQDSSECEIVEDVADYVQLNSVTTVEIQATHLLNHTVHLDKCHLSTKLLISVIFYTKI